MRNFESIESLLEFNFQEMRALGHRASDEALINLHLIFKTFFDQFRSAPPSIEELQLYVNLLTHVVARINQFEYAYYINKYQTEFTEMSAIDIEKMARGCQIKNYQQIPIRLQFWAAGEAFGDSIRFPLEHRATIKNLEKWQHQLEKDNISPQI
jgi:hypothetical protein